ncbi:phosphonate C-P lyase system protein PhnG [Rhabdaerophilum sp.]|uniref:phosphonate C-P lyase system protein PhnG n=1 Tax=Rhabdaerophilum sp. TaxID=2717341 RepID=UPI0038D3C85B
MPDTQAARQNPDCRAATMALLARATREELALPLSAHWPNLAHATIRAPEIGLVMLRGRMGGDGAPFNLGEATVTRAVVELATGERGYGQFLGRDPARAEQAAILEALARREADRLTVEREVLAPIRQRLALEAQKKRAETAATRVDFFTLVRAEG